MLGVMVYQRLSGDAPAMYDRPAFLVAVMLLVLAVQFFGLGLVCGILRWLSRPIKNP